MKSKQQLNSLALQRRQEWKEDAYAPIDIFAIVSGWQERKITLVRYPLSSRISGLCTKEESDVVIYINSTSSYGRQRFSLAHELYHVLYEDDKNQVICGMNMSGDRPESEREADMFASYLLMPYDALVQYRTEQTGWDLDKIINAEQFFQISHQAMLYRLVVDGFISQTEADQFKNITVSTEAAKRGYGRELYLPTDPERQYFTTGEYVRKVEQLTDRELISHGKREELLLDAYRADIVFNLDGEEMRPND